MKLFETVPNISIGQRTDLLNKLFLDLNAIPGLSVLDVDADDDAGRTVLTMVGIETGICDGIEKIFDFADTYINMFKHKGKHPRVGAVDVVPIVPFQEVNFEDAQHLVLKIAKKIIEKHPIPVYLYGKSTKSPSRKKLSVFRKGGFENLKDRLASKEWNPDFGKPHVNHLGATVMGVRNFLIAFNITTDIENPHYLENVVFKLRSIKHLEKRLVDAIWWHLPKRNIYQISTNVRNFKLYGILDVFETVTTELKKIGGRIVFSEIVGMIPSEAIAHTLSNDNLIEFKNRIKLDISLGKLKEKILEQKGTFSLGHGH